MRFLSRAPGYDPGTHGWGTPEWTRAWTQLFDEGKAAGLQVDQIYTPGWSAGVPGLSPDGPGTAKELTFGSAYLNAGETFDGPLPTSTLPAGVSKRLLQGVVAYRCEENCLGLGTSTPVLDSASGIDLTDSVADGSLRWTAPSKAEESPSPVAQSASPRRRGPQSSCAA